MGSATVLPTEAPASRVFYPALDGLRSIAFLMVFFQHYIAMQWGWTGVNIFFVLSGFLITGILFDTRNDPHHLRNFYVRRTLRIFPLYYGIMALILLLMPVMHWPINWHWLIWPAYLGNILPFVRSWLPEDQLQQLLYFQLPGSNGNFYTTLFLGHFWSLCVEEQFYLFWPWLVFFIRDRRQLLLLCAATVPICLALRITGQHHLSPWLLAHGILNRDTPFCVDALFLGGALALFLRGNYAHHLLRFARFALPISLILVSLLAILTGFHHIFSPTYTYPTGVFTWDVVIINIVSALLVLCALQPGTILYRFLSLKPLRWLGRITYGAYVLHDIPHLIYLFIGETLFPAHPQIAGVSIALICTIALAWLSFRFFETPFLNLKDRLTLRS